MLLFSPFDFITVVVGLIYAYPWALILLPRQRRSWLMILITTLGLSVGGLTVGMMILSLIDKLMLTWVLAGILVAFSLGSGWMMRARTLHQTVPPREVALRLLQSMRDHPLLALLVVLVSVQSLLILINALYWPFGDDDAVSIYAFQARGIYQTRDLPRGEGLYEAYPMLVQLSYVYAYLAAGEMNEYLARLFPAMLALGALSAAASLGGALFNRRVGLYAAALLALIPAFVRWGSSGYTDVPSSFFFTMAVLFAWRMVQASGKRDAALMGLMAGFAMWTKNSTLTLALSVPAWLVIATWRKRIAAPHWGFALGGMALAGGPWYVRNWIEFGLLVPKTAWTDQAVHNVRTLFPFFGHFDQFFVIGPLLTVGLLWGLVEAVRAARQGRDELLVLWVFVLPFAAAWWWMASYEVRFLLTVLPLICVMTGRFVDWLLDVTWGERHPALLLRAALAILLVLLALPAMRKAVMFKDDLLRQPLMDDDERHTVRLGPVYNVARYLNSIPSEGTILTDTYFLPLHVNRGTCVVGSLSSRSYLPKFDYIVYSPGSMLPPDVQPGDVELLQTINGFQVYRVTYHG